ncbi:arrestin domain-containing protein 3-like isoform X2 [Megalopta genalis]|uniref:arrestin domain-containing protein 3-like isoform X2 n=1 Tax=Megalopta genalis TaxID=115081 RepID=UPI003FD072DA
MPSLRTFTIELDRPGAVYQAGESVTGNIIVNTSEEKSVRGLYIIAKGTASVNWTEWTPCNDGKVIGTIDNYYDSEQYFRIKVNVLGSSKSDSRVEIKEGYHQYPFRFQLPSNIPSSFEHKHGYVRYTVEAVIDRPWKFDHECKIAFTVASVLDLNMHRHRCLGIHDEIRKNFCCCCFGRDSMNTSIRVPSSGYVSGQTISASVNYKNTSSKVGITKIELKLERVLKLRAITEMKTEYFKIISSSHTGPFTPDGVITLEIRVPPILPSHLPFCSIINLDYCLKVVVYFTGTHLKLQRRYPLLIGTIPLHCEPSAPAIQQMKAMPHPTEQPATSSTMSMPETPQPSTSTANSLDHAPPSYKECMLGAQNIRDDDESVHVPKYPVFNYLPPSKYFIKEEASFHTFLTSCHQMSYILVDFPFN